MPNAECPCNACTNCVKLTMNGRLIGFFKDQFFAEFYVKACETPSLGENAVTIEPWFIEGEF